MKADGVPSMHDGQIIQVLEEGASSSHSPERRRLLGGILVHKECWTRSWRGEAFLLLKAFSSGLFI